MKEALQVIFSYKSMYLHTSTLKWHACTHTEYKGHIMQMYIRISSVLSKLILYNRNEPQENFILIISSVVFWPYGLLDLLGISSHANQIYL